MTITIVPESMIRSEPTAQTTLGLTSSSQVAVDTHLTDAAVASPKADSPAGTFSPGAKSGPISTEAAPQGDTLPASHRRDESQTTTAGGMLLYNPYLCLLSDSLDDLEELRIATDNRVRALTRKEADSDGEMRGLGLDARSPEVARAMSLAERIGQLEHQAVLDLKREIRRSPFFPWVQRSKGIGEKQAARLLAVIGDPYWNDLHERPRTVFELWAYCGYAVHNGRADRRQKGVLSNWDDKAKKRAYLMAESCVKSGGGYREVYDAARAHYADATHPHGCVRCGPKGKPALAGTTLSAGHQHARALRLVAKEILKDLWLEARAYHEGEASA